MRSCHRDDYTAMAAVLDAPAGHDYERRIEQAETEIDNLRAAFGWSRENSTSSWRWRWRARCSRCGQRGAASGKAGVVRRRPGRPRRATRSGRGRGAGAGAGRQGRARRLGGRRRNSLGQAQQALSIAREVNDPALLARALTACGGIATILHAEAAEPYFAEAIGLARAVDDRWRLSQILAGQASAASYAGDPIATARSPRKDATSPRRSVTGTARGCAAGPSDMQVYQGDLVGAAAQFGELVAEAKIAHDGLIEANSLAGQGIVLAYQGDTVAARASADAAIEAAAELGGLPRPRATRRCRRGPGRRRCCDAAGRDRGLAAAACRAPVRGGAAAFNAGPPWRAGIWSRPAAGRRSGHDGDRLFPVGGAVARARVAIAQGEPDQGERDAHDALACAADVKDLPIPDILECLAGLAGDAGSHREATRLFGAAHAIRNAGAVRFKIGVTGCRPPSRRCETRGRERLESAWAQGAALFVEEAIAYTQRGRGERNARQPAGARSRPPSVTWCGWSVRDWAIRTLPPGFSSHRGPCKPTSRTSTPNSA